MTATAADIVVLHCDQGMGTLVRIWEDVMGTEELTYLVLLDLGTEGSAKRFDGLAVDHVIYALKKMDDPMLDLVVISHQDRDHWSLLPTLLARIQTEVSTCKLGRYYKGGLYWKKTASKVVKQFGDHFGVTCKPWTDTVGNYYRPKKNNPGNIGVFAGVAFRLLTVNADSTKSEENGTSAVVVVDFGGSRGIIPGDATSQTLSEINSIVKDWEKQNGENPIRPCYIMSAPHHGALFTISDNFTTTNPKLKTATKFAQNTQTEWLAASAGYLSKFSHPFKNVMKLLGYKVGAGATSHDFVWYDDAKAKWKQVPATKQNIFTTVTNLDDPPDVHSWVFTMYPSGTVTFRRERTPRRPEDIRPPAPDPGVSGPAPDFDPHPPRPAGERVMALPKEILRAGR